MERTQVQYTVSVKNEVGQLRRLALALAQEKIAVLGLSWQAEGEAGLIRFVTERTLGVAQALERLGWSAVQSPVLTVPVPTRPGELARLLKVLDDAGLGVLEMYGTAAPGETCRLVLAVDRPEVAEKVLAGFTDTVLLATR